MPRRCMDVPSDSLVFLTLSAAPVGPDVLQQLNVFREPQSPRVSAGGTVYTLELLGRLSSRVGHEPVEQLARISCLPSFVFIATLRHDVGINVAVMLNVGAAIVRRGGCEALVRRMHVEWLHQRVKLGTKRFDGHGGEGHNGPTFSGRAGA